VIFDINGVGKELAKDAAQSSTVNSVDYDKLISEFFLSLFGI